MIDKLCLVLSPYFEIWIYASYITANMNLRFYQWRQKSNKKINFVNKKVFFIKFNKKYLEIHFKMLQEKMEQLVAFLEKQEQENLIQDPKLYDELFAAYLYFNDL